MGPAGVRTSKPVLQTFLILVLVWDGGFGMLPVHALQARPGTQPRRDPNSLWEILGRSEKTARLLQQGKIKDAERPGPDFDVLKSIADLVLGPDSAGEAQAHIKAEAAEKEAERKRARLMRIEEEHDQSVAEEAEREREAMHLRSALLTDNGALPVNRAPLEARNEALRALYGISMTSTSSSSSTASFSQSPHPSRSPRAVPSASASSSLVREEIGAQSLLGMPVDPSKPYFDQVFAKVVAEIELFPYRVQAKWRHTILELEGRNPALYMGDLAQLDAQTTSSFFVPSGPASFTAMKFPLYFLFILALLWVSDGEIGTFCADYGLLKKAVETCDEDEKKNGPKKKASTNEPTPCKQAKDWWEIQYFTYEEEEGAIPIVEKGPRDPVTGQQYQCAEVLDDWWKKYSFESRCYARTYDVLKRWCCKPDDPGACGDNKDAAKCEMARTNLEKCERQAQEEKRKKPFSIPGMSFGPKHRDGDSFGQSQDQLMPVIMFLVVVWFTLPIIFKLLAMAKPVLSLPRFPVISPLPSRSNTPTISVSMAEPSLSPSSTPSPTASTSLSVSPTTSKTPSPTIGHDDDPNQWDGWQEVLEQKIEEKEEQEKEMEAKLNELGFGPEPSPTPTIYACAQMDDYRVHSDSFPGWGIVMGMCGDPGGDLATAPVYSATVRSRYCNAAEGWSVCKGWQLYSMGSERINSKSPAQKCYVYDADVQDGACFSDCQSSTEVSGQRTWAKYNTADAVRLGGIGGGCPSVSYGSEPTSGCSAGFKAGGAEYTAVEAPASIVVCGLDTGNIDGALCCNSDTNIQAACQSQPGRCTNIEEAGVAMEDADIVEAPSFIMDSSLPAAERKSRCLWWCANSDDATGCEFRQRSDGRLQCNKILSIFIQGGDGEDPKSVCWAFNQCGGTYKILYKKKSHDHEAHDREQHMKVLVQAEGTQSYGRAFWQAKCQEIPETAEYIRIKLTQGGYDFYKPVGNDGVNSDMCTMLAGDPCMFTYSATGLTNTWKSIECPSVDDAAPNMIEALEWYGGGSLKGYPKENLRNDGREYTAFWGADIPGDIRGGGCCYNEKAPDMDSAEMRWGLGFEMSYYDPGCDPADTSCGMEAPTDEQVAAQLSVCSQEDSCAGCKYVVIDAEGTTQSLSEMPVGWADSCVYKEEGSLCGTTTWDCAGCVGQQNGQMQAQARCSGGSLLGHASAHRLTFAQLADRRRRQLRQQLSPHAP